MLKPYLWIYPILIIFYIQIILFYFFPVYEYFVDYFYYQAAFYRLINNQELYKNNFVYLPSFFILAPFILNKMVYFIFLISCLVVSSILLLKLENNIGKVLFFILLPLLYLYNGNIDPFIFLILLICCYYIENEIIIPILLAIISFKPTIIMILPYFIYNSKNRKKFILIYISCLLILNIYIIINYSLIISFLDYLFFEHGHYIDILRPYWIYYIYYFGMKRNYKKKEKIKKFYESSINKSSE